MSLDLPTIRRVARTVRSACERLAPDLGYDGATLALFCPFASTAITRALRDAGERAVLVAGSCSGINHFWTMIHGPAGLWDEGPIVDVSATQFGGRWPKVAITLPHQRRARTYAMMTYGPIAERCIPHEDVDMLRVLPERWWTRIDDRASTLDARVLTKLQSDPDVRPENVGTTKAGLLDALSRLAKRPPVYDLTRAA